jgi:hypothetical protein
VRGIEIGNIHPDGRKEKFVSDKNNAPYEVLMNMQVEGQFSFQWNSNGLKEVI